MKKFPRVAVAAALALLFAVPLPARATHLHSRHSDCISRVRAAPARTLDVGEINVHGWVSGGRIGAMILPEIPGVVPAGSQSDADVAALPVDYDESGVTSGAPIDVTMAGFLGGGTTKLRPPAGVVVTSAGAQRLILESFTGRYRALRRSYVCESRRRARTVYRFSYYEVWFAGLRAPTAAGSPLSGWGFATGLKIFPGDVAAR